MCYVTIVTYLFIIQEIKEKEKKKKNQIKKIDKKKKNQNKI